MAEQYQWQKQLDAKPSKKIANFQPEFGIQVKSRCADSRAREVTVSLYTHDQRPSLYIIGPFNEWGQAKDMSSYKLGDIDEAGFQRVALSNGELQHKTPYLFSDYGVIKRDPASTYFDEKGNSVFWDFEDSRAYSFKYRRPDRANRAVKILQTDLHGLISHFRSTDGKLGNTIPLNQNYRFITESGVIQKISELGFNAVQFLPVGQSIDGEKWSFRYLVPYLYAINNRWGDPDDFAEMVDTFHHYGITVIIDHVISHVPHQRFRLFDIPNRKIGIHRWVGANAESVFLGEETSWGTKRYQYHNPVVRRFIEQSAVSLIKNYRIDGFRIDNVDGILRHGVNGDGPERHGGRELLRELASSVYEYDPYSYIHLESHYFHGDNAKLLTLDLNSNERALGASAYTSSRLTHYFHKEYMPKSAAQVSPWSIKDLIDEKEWGMSNSTVADFHNHDAAAGLMPMRATGSYAYDALILKDPSLHQHAVGKIKVMEALISFGMEGRTLDLMQTHLLQSGTFEHDSTIHWFQEQVPAAHAVLKFKAEVNKALDHEAFWFRNVEYRKYANVHEDSKSIVIHRSASQDGDFVIFINIAAHLLFDFQLPVPKAGGYKLILNSDDLEFAGTGQAFIPTSITSVKSDQFEFYSNAIELGSVPPYAVLVFQNVLDS